MSTSKRFCLKWADFQGNITTAFAALKEESDFADVTLACDTHKVILSSSISFFKNLLKRNKHAHPLIYMRGFKYDDPLALVDFLYYGEANVYQENLENFLAIAEALQLKGLQRGPIATDNVTNSPETVFHNPYETRNVYEVMKKEQSDRLYGNKSRYFNC